MATTGLLTILAILISGYSLLPDEKRLDLRLRISWLDLVIVGIPVIAILIVIYSPVILSTGLIKPVGWRWGFTENTMVFTCLTAIILLFGWKVVGSRLPKINYSRWAESSVLCLRNKKYEHLGYLLNKYHIQLFDVIDNKVWYVRLHDYLVPQAVILKFSRDVTRPFYEPHVDSLRMLLAKPFPARCKKQDDLELSISRLLKSTPFVEYLAEAYPMVAAKASCVQFRDYDEFISSFFRALISHSGSPLYRELRDNQSCSYTGEYDLDESNPLLNFYLKDIAVAERVGIWKPIGDYVIEYIREQRGTDNFYNQPNDCFSDGEARWASPIFIGSLFFEVMVSVAIFQRAKNHMFLMYTDNFLEEILESLEYAESVDGGREFPSKFDYLMYQIFSACDSWVGTIEHLDLKKASWEDIRRFPEYYAAKTLGSMLRKIIASAKLSDSQKIYFLEITAKRMRGLDQNNSAGYSKVIFDHIVREYAYAATDNEFVRELSRLYYQIDHVVRSKESTFEVAISECLCIE